LNTGGSLIQILPRAPGDCGGVGDYSRQLARRLREAHGITSTFISAAPIESSRTADGFAILSPLRTLSEVVESRTALLLHYVNYGYDPHGVPVWLPSVLRRLQKAGGGRLVTIFHELYAAGSWRQSAFWLRPVQKHIARAIARLSATSIVSNETQAAQLEQLASGTQIVVQPVTSNFGEPSLSLTELAERDPHRWIICGGTELLERSLTSFLPNAPRITAPYSPRELFVVGGTDSEEIRARLARLQAIQTHYHSKVDGSVAAQILSTCAFAWIDYFHQPDVPMATILKSGVFAAFCAHGVIPAFPHDGSAIHLGQDTLPGPFFVTEARQNLPAEPERARVAQSLHDWYRRNASSQRLAETVAAAIDRSAQPYQPCP
jgi:hypothetical protein